MIQSRVEHELGTCEEGGKYDQNTLKFLNNFKMRLERKQCQNFKDTKGKNFLNIPVIYFALYVKNFLFIGQSCCG